MYQYKVLCAFISGVARNNGSVIHLFKVRGLGEAPGIQKAYSMFVIEKNYATKGLIPALMKHSKRNIWTTM